MAFNQDCSKTWEGSHKTVLGPDHALILACEDDRIAEVCMVGVCAIVRAGGNSPLSPQ